MKTVFMTIAMFASLNSSANIQYEKILTLNVDVSLQEMVYSDMSHESSVYTNQKSLITNNLPGVFVDLSLEDIYISDFSCVLSFSSEDPIVLEAGTEFILDNGSNSNNGMFTHRARLWVDSELSTDITGGLTCNRHTRGKVKMKEILNITKPLMSFRKH